MAIETVSQHTGQKYTEQQYRDVLESIAARTSALRDLITTMQELQTPHETGGRMGVLLNAAFYMTADIGAMSDDACGGQIVGPWQAWVHGLRFVESSKPLQ